MGQGLYRCLGFGCLNPPPFAWDSDLGQMVHDVVHTSCDAEPLYLIVPMAIDEAFLRETQSLPSLPAGLPHVEDRTAVTVARCRSWTDVGKLGVWIPQRIVATWELVRFFARTRGVQLPPGEPVFVCDWD